MRKGVIVGLAAITASVVTPLIATGSAFDSKDPALRKTAARLGVPNTQWKRHERGNLRMIITNLGALGRGGLSVPDTLIAGEYPANSKIEHLYGAGVWVGAIVGGQKYVSFAYEGWAGDDDGQLVEFFPTDAPDDTIYTTSTEEVDTPNKRHVDDDGDGRIDEDDLNNRDDDGDGKVDEDYGAVSQQDFICQFQDDFRTDLPNHHPLHIKMIQKSYSWNTPYAEAIIFVEFKIISKNTETLRDVYIGFFADLDVGPAWVRRNREAGWPGGYDHNFWEVNYTAFQRDRMLAYIANPVDKPSTPLGVTIVKTPRRLEDLKVSFHWYPGDGSPKPDSKRYDYLSDGVIQSSQSPSELSDTRFLFGFGSFNLAPKDTLDLVVAWVSGMTIAEMFRNADRARSMYANDYRVPSPPPSPPLKLEVGHRVVTLHWDVAPGDPRNPEAFVDTTNYTAVRHFGGRTFAGYRLYRSETGNLADFTLLAEYDKPGDGFGYENGLAYAYVDSNLVNGKTYWYSVTSYSIPDTVTLHTRESLESSLLQNMVTAVPHVLSASSLKNIYVVPNPYRGDEDYTQGIRWEGDPLRWTEDQRKIQFVNLPPKCTIRIFTLAGNLVAVLEHDNPDSGTEDWNLQSAHYPKSSLEDPRRTIAPGIYLFSVESVQGTFVGKFVVIK